MKETVKEHKENTLNAEELFGKAEILLRDRNHGEAVQMLKKAITLNRHFSFAYITLSKILFKMHRIDDAIKTLEQCASTDTSYAYPYYLIAKFLYASGKTTEAKTMLERAHRIDKNSRLYGRALTALRSEKKP